MRLRLLAFMLVFAASARAGVFDCSESAARRVSATASGVTRVVVIGHAGSLRISGRPGAREVVATGTACADSKDMLNDIQLRARQSGSELRVEAAIPELSGFFGWNHGKLDFEVTLPDSVALDVRDGSGETVIENVGDLKVDDGSGELTIRGVHGNANVTDGSGALTVADVSGDVRIHDGSGEIEIERIGGNVVIDDGSGGIRIRNVQRGVTIEDDGSGSVDVSDVRGDFTVESKGSGSVDYDRIGGKVSVPRRHRDRN
ncbi:MAG TPA: hypothetical protein VGS96_20280 [Thermoanaerobaculia bacterium]|nr:hypothetical protein [Thermoanaerobaculia bacterium]